jgi:hypothetical protein
MLQGTFRSSDNSSSIVAPHTNMSHSWKQFDFQCFPSTAMLYTCTRCNLSVYTPPLLMTREVERTLTYIACGEKFFTQMVILVLNSGLKNDMLRRKREERRNCFTELAYASSAAVPGSALTCMTRTRQAPQTSDMYSKEKSRKQLVQNPMDVLHNGTHQSLLKEREQHGEKSKS